MAGQRRKAPPPSAEQSCSRCNIPLRNRCAVLKLRPKVNIAESRCHTTPHVKLRISRWLARRDLVYPRHCPGRVAPPRRLGIASASRGLSEFTDVTKFRPAPFAAQRNNPDADRKHG